MENINYLCKQMAEVTIMHYATLCITSVIFRNHIKIINHSWKHHDRVKQSANIKTHIEHF